MKECSNCDVYETIKKKKIGLPAAAKDTPYLRTARPFGKNLVYVSGAGCNWQGSEIFHGIVPCDVNFEEAKRASENCARALLSNLESEIGDLNRVKSVIKLIVFVAIEPGYSDIHLVANGASGIIIEALGEKAGKAARSAIGVCGLPDNIPVEVEALVELKEEA